MDDIQEQQTVSNEILEAISNPPAFGAGIDDDELLKELEQLEQEAVQSKLSDVPTADSISANLPSVPSAQPGAVKKKAEHESELDDLVQWAS